MQHDMNNRLLLLLDPISAQLPTLSGQQVQDHAAQQHPANLVHNRQPLPGHMLDKCFAFSIGLLADHGAGARDACI